MHGRGSVNDNPVKQTKKRKIFWSIISHYRHSKHSNRQSISNWKGGHFYSCCSSPRWNASSRVSLQLQQKFKKTEKPQVLFESLFYVEMRQNTRSEYLWILGLWSHDQKQQTKHNIPLIKATNLPQYFADQENVSIDGKQVKRNIDESERGWQLPGAVLEALQCQISWEIWNFDRKENGRCWCWLLFPLNVKLSGKMKWTMWIWANESFPPWCWWQTW